MIVGHKSTFAIESEIGVAYERLGWMGLGFFSIIVKETRYGFASPDSTLLACSYDAVQRRIENRGKHCATFTSESAFEVANSIYQALYGETTGKELYFDIPQEKFSALVYANSLIWAPDGDEAFDDGSYVLQFDIDLQVRLIAFKVDSFVVVRSTLREIWISADQYYSTLKQWYDAFTEEWIRLPKQQST